MANQLRPTWKKLLLEHAPAFLKWLKSNRIQQTSFSKLAKDLETYLFKFSLHKNFYYTKREACEIFTSNLPVVLSNCDEDIYDDPFVADAYAYVHLLDRYRRFWDVLTALTVAGVLPMKDDGIDVLDVGTGPAPALYAVTDFYRALREYATQAECTFLNTPSPRLHCIESSKGMVHLMHVLSEIAKRQGPFSADFTQFDGLNLETERLEERAKRIRQAIQEDDAFDLEAQRIAYGNFWRDTYRYNLCIFSNFLTQTDQVHQLETELRSVFNSLRAGGTVIIVGGTSIRYQNIYSLIENLSSQTRARKVANVPSFIETDYANVYARRIKRLYIKVWTQIEKWHPNPNNIKQKIHEDIWNKELPLRGPRKFALRVFRRGKL